MAIGYRLSATPRRDRTEVADGCCSRKPSAVSRQPKPTWCSLCGLPALQTGGWQLAAW